MQLTLRQLDASFRISMKPFARIPVLLCLMSMPFIACEAAGTPARAVDADATNSALRVEDRRLSIRLKGANYSLAARVFHPAGVGPFPLVVINHGSSVSIREMRALTLDYAYSDAAHWFASQGYVVVVALRPGVGTSQGPYFETTRPCARRDYVGEGRATAAVEAAIVQSAAALPGVDPKRIVVVGHSAGGFGGTALADQPPPGVLGIISFAGGRGGDGHEHICGGQDRLVRAAGVFGRGNTLPGLWLYAANDHFFPLRSPTPCFKPIGRAHVRR